MSNDSTIDNGPLAPFALWIDGVGGYLVCFSAHVTLGLSQDEMPIDIGLIADVSRHHATIQEESGDYFLQAVRDVYINGKAVSRTPLRSGDRFTLGDSCQLQFWQPVPVSHSARLDLVSGQRFAQPVQAVLLLANTLVIGPQEQSHVQVPDMKHQLVLFHDKGSLTAVWPGYFTVSGTSFKNRGPLESGARLETEQITLTLERVR